MKNAISIVIVLAALAVCASTASAQFTESRLPVYYSVHGGLFFPSHESFRNTFKTASDIVWGFGLAFPITDDYLYLQTDIAWFKSEGYIEAAADSTAKLDERFIHLGLVAH